MRKEIDKLTQRQHQPAQNTSSAEKNAKRKQAASDETSKKVTRLARRSASRNVTPRAPLFKGPSPARMRAKPSSPLRQQNLPSYTVSFRYLRLVYDKRNIYSSSKLLHKMKFNIWAVPRNGTTIVTDNEIISTSLSINKENVNSESLLMNTVSLHMKAHFKEK